MAEFVSVQSSGGLATIRLDRPPVNALSIALQVSYGTRLSRSARTRTSGPW